MNDLQCCCQNSLKSLKDFWISSFSFSLNNNNHLISARRPNLVIVNKRKRTSWIGDFAVPADPRVKIKEKEKRYKYLDLARELKKLQHMKVMVIPVIIGALGMIPKNLVRGLEELEIGGRAKTIQTTARILRKVQETHCHSDSSERPNNAGVKNS